MLKKLCYIIINYTFLLICLTQKVFAIALITDDEIENSLKKLATPIIRAANLNPDNISIRLVQDKSANAFVADNRNIFLNTGLLLAFADNPEAILGVIAHEIGHIKAGHLLRNQEKLAQVRKTTITSLILATAAAVAGGHADGVATAVIGSSHIGEREILRHSRENEETADQIAVNLLKKVQMSPQGLSKVLKYFKQLELASYDSINPYTLTHPISRERLAFIKNNLNNLSYSPITLSSTVRNDFIRSMKKLKAFLEPADITLKSIPNNNETNDIYARAIALFKLFDLNKSINLMKTLIAREPNNPYFLEFTGQILFENGYIQDSIKYYESAHKLHPKALGIKLGLAVALIASTDNIQNFSNLNQSINYLKQVIEQEDDNLLVLKFLAIAYGRQGQIGIANAILAHSAMLNGDTQEAKKFAKLASNQLPKDHPYIFKVQDILNAVK
ncbi:MAG: M48 family metalloprotease [Rickettsiales endosymbiont of Dermacentor nuttalli]